MKLLVHYDKPEPLLDVVRRRHPRIELACCTDYESLPAILKRENPELLFGILFANSAFPRAAILDTTSVQWVCVGGSGTDHLAPWDAARLTVTNTAGVAAESMAQYVIGGILHFTLDLAGFGTHQRNHSWTSGSVTSVTGKRMIILGLGKTGQAVAKLAKALGMEVIGIRARPAPTEDVDRVEPMERMHDVLGTGDFIVVCLPLTPRTRGLLDADAFRAMRRGAILADVSRGGVVQQSALLDALEDGRVGGAVLDVFEKEPLPAGSRLWDAKNVIITPHCSSVYEGWETRAMEMFCDNLDRWIQGRPLENLVDPNVGY